MYSILLIILNIEPCAEKTIGPANAVVAHNSTPANAAIALTFLLFIPQLVANSSLMYLMKMINKMMK